MIVLHLSGVGTLLVTLEEPARQEVRAVRTEHGRYPAHRTWERRRAPVLYPLYGSLGYLLPFSEPWCPTIQTSSRRWLSTLRASSPR